MTLIEGLFSFSITSLLLVISYFVPVPFDMGQYRCVFEDAIDGFVQLGNNPILLGCFIGKYVCRVRPWSNQNDKIKPWWIPW